MLQIVITKNDKTPEHSYTILKHGNFTNQYPLIIDRFKRAVIALRGEKAENYIVWLSYRSGLSMCSVECDADGKKRYYIGDKQTDRVSFIKWINHVRAKANKVGVKHG